MLYAQEWIRAHVSTFFWFIEGFIQDFTLGAITGFIGSAPELTLLFALAGLALMIFGFRSYKMLSSIAGAAIMGVLGWYLGGFINPNLLNANILTMFVFIIAGLPIFYALSAINAFLIPFLLCFVLVREFFNASILIALLVGAAVATVFCLYLLRRVCLRTSIEGGIILGLTFLSFYGYIVAFLIFAASAAGGTVLQHSLKKRHDLRKKELSNFRPNAPSPPTREEIAKEIEEEARERLERKRAPTPLPEGSKVSSELAELMDPEELAKLAEMPELTIKPVRPTWQSLGRL